MTDRTDYDLAKYFLFIEILLSEQHQNFKRREFASCNKRAFDSYSTIQIEWLLRCLFGKNESTQAAVPHISYYIEQSKDRKEVNHLKYILAMNIFTHSLAKVEHISYFWQSIIACSTTAVIYEAFSIFRHTLWYHSLVPIIPCLDATVPVALLQLPHW